jgi:hypothetical protein
MKVKNLSQINAFGGINFVLNEFEKLSMDQFLSENLPLLSPNSKYSWTDIFYSFSSVFYCGGNCIEDTKTVLSNQFSTNPFFKLCSPDTILRRFKNLATAEQHCYTPRGVVQHQFCVNDTLASANIELLKKNGVFDVSETILDYDNTIVFNEKADSKMTYKRAYGYQPGVCMINEENVLYIENRNGNSDAKSFQVDTLNRMFYHIYKDQKTKKINKFRADAASYQHEVIQCLEQNVDTFYIGTRNSYVEKYYSQIENWIPAKDQKGEDVLIGSIEYCPFLKKKEKGSPANKYRLLVKKKIRPDGQTNLITNDAFDYHSVITNDFTTDLKIALDFYYHRGAAEKQFDILKNDFGWNNLPFSNLNENTVFLYFSAMCKNLYKTVLNNLSKSYKNINPKHRIKRFIFSFIAIPARWTRSSRHWCLSVFGKIPLTT